MVAERIDERANEDDPNFGFDSQMPTYNEP